MNKQLKAESFLPPPWLPSQKERDKSVSNSLRSRLFFWVKILLTLSVLILLVVTIHPQEIIHAFTRSRFPLVLVSLGLVIPNLILRALKWGYLLRQVKPSSVREILNTLLVGFTFALVTPGQLGEFGRAFFISGRPRLELIGISIIDKLYNLLPIILCGSLGILLLPGLALGTNTYIIASCCILVALLWLISLLILLSPGWIRDLLYAINVMLPYRDKIKILLGAMNPIKKRQSLILAGLGTAHYLISIIQFHLLVLSFQPISIADSLRASSATMFVKALLPISIGGLGVGETAAVGFFRQFDIGRAAAFNSSVMLFSMNIVLPAVIGFLILLKLRIEPERTEN